MASRYHRRSVRASILALAAALVAAACAPLSTAPAPSATPATAPTALPVMTYAPEPSVAVPSGSAGDRGASPVVATPRPALGLPVVSAPCAVWPTDVEPVQTHLILPPSMCLLRTADASVDHLVCTVVGCVPVTRGCVEQGYCTQIVPGTTPRYVLVFIRAPASRPPPIGETYVLTRSICRMHQDRTVMDATLPGAPPPAGGWLATTEAREFGIAFSAFQAAYPDDAARWKPKPSDLENYADVCAAWYYPPARDQRVSDYAPLATWAKKWLPQ